MAALVDLASMIGHRWGYLAKSQPPEFPLRQEFLAVSFFLLEG